MGSIGDVLPHWAIKVIGTIILFLLSMIFGAIPLKLSRDENHPTSRLRTLLISLSNCFAGGVFFSTVILDLFPLVKEKADKALKSVDIQTEFPLGEFIVGFGFIMMLILEQFVHTCCGDSFLSHPGHSHDVEEDVFHNHHFEEQSDLDSDEEREQLLTPSVSAINPDESKTRPDSSRKHVSLGTAEVLHGNSVTYSDSENENDPEGSQVSYQSYDTFFSQNGTHHRIKKMDRAKSLASMQSITHSNFRTYVLVFAISLHSLFEGLSVGLLVDIKTLLQILLALLIHKSIIAFSIGVQLVEADLRSVTVLVCLSIFAIMAPLGVGIGILVLNYLNEIVKLFCSAVLQSIATGSFLYVTFFEVLPHELNIDDNKKPLKILFVLFGYALTTGLCYYEHGFHKMAHIPINNGTKF